MVEQLDMFSTSCCDYEEEQKEQPENKKTIGFQRQWLKKMFLWTS